jgi:UDP-N-acetylglucosamine pyrophosphorylase
MASFIPCEEKMFQANLSPAAIAAFKANFAKLVAGDTGLLPESAIDPVQSLPTYDADVKGKGFAGAQLDELLHKTIVLKLNGGLGTSMGLEKAKSLLLVKDGETFLTLIAKQIQHVRTEHEGVKFILMNSFATSTDTLEALRVAGFADMANERDVQLMQNSSPKVNLATMLPVAHPADPELEWCPPGHGDLYAALLGSGMLDRLLAQGKRYLFVSNADNLGATLDVELLSFFAASGKAFLMEVAERTESDKKGGHLALHKGTSRMVLRESAMCPKEDMDAFQEIARHRFFNTNNIWLDLEEVSKVMKANGGTMPLPLIKNKKTVDPRDASSTPVLQLETAMGAAIESFANAGAVVVPRSRFAPVKTTADLFGLRSDAFVTTPDFRVVLASSRRDAPIITLDDKRFKLVDQMEALAPQPPSLVKCDRITVTGPVFFQHKGVVVEGTVEFVAKGDAPQAVAPGLYRDQQVLLG